ncbi:glycosyl hydrolase [Paenibacillus sp. HN-1]|uniref:glycosyl hydrolase family 18 protein n=1 Tax=Paenibacillus TaxID=44249 RepID=UPI001CA8839B|nr:MULTISPECIES: glycosyl hydrolase family 18 protein [Paenibacillus]MBY9077090.1 glycosyl hydrolase [Paenibacillus sp. CGMCC 1.18879]MBY9086537.1 glycosyl hydrolase [Paenibacillus sinensis]
MSRRSKSRRTRPVKRGGFLRKLAGLLIIAAAACALVLYVLPNPFYTDPEWKGKDKPIFIKGEYTGYSASGEGERLLLPLPLLQEAVDPAIRYEKGTQSVILTTDRKLLYMQADKTAATLNNQPVQLRLAPVEKGGTILLPAESLKNLYGLDIQENKDTGAVLLMTAGEKVQLGVIKDKKASMRSEATIHAPILSKMVKGAKLRIWKKQGDWLYAQMDNGYAGYVRASAVQDNGSKTVEKAKSPPTRAERSWKGKAVNLTWEAVYNSNPDTSSMGTLKGVNVVSPTWFKIVDDQGNVRSQGDPAYVTWAHAKGKEVWGLLSNSFDADLTTKALSTYENRMRTIVQMLEYADLYGLDGINIDFENVYTDDGDNVTQFVRELRPMAQAKNLILSIDVTPKSNSEMWSLFFDRRALGELVDFMIVMAYDEHWASSPVAGSVASLSWSQTAMERILDEDDVPADKLVLGVPLYTRIWSEQTVDGKTKVSSKSVGMSRAAAIISEKKLKPVLSKETGQNYVEYKENGALNKIWIEDKVSLQSRVKLAKSLKLAGIASWNRSFAGEGAWETLNTIHQ